MGDTVFKITSRIITWVLSAVAIVLLIYSCYVIQDMLYIQMSAFRSADIAQYKPVVTEEIDDAEVPLVNASALAQVNKDYRAWLTMFGTQIDYPVMQGENDIYYAAHDIHGKSSFSGAIYLATGCKYDFSDNYNVMFGHHMDNGAMFGDLDRYKIKNFIERNRTGMLIAPDRIYELTVFAVMSTDAYDEKVYNTGNRDFTELLGYIEANASYYDADEAKGAVKILAMSTCADTTTNGRLVVFASMKETDTVLTDPNAEEEVIEDDPTPLTNLPSGDERKWALLNLICMIFTIYILLPVLHIRHKYRRKKIYKNVAEDEEFEAFLKLQEEAECGNGEEENIYEKDRKRFGKRIVIGTVIEIVLAVCAVIAFILTEDIRLKMQVIDKWTPLMLIILIAAWVADIVFANIKKERIKELTELEETAEKDEKDNEVIS